MGYFKKVFVVDFLIVIFFGDDHDARWAGRLRRRRDQPAGGRWRTCIIVFVRAYFDLSAYTDLAIGFSRLFGFRIMENFHYPFWKTNLAEFWRGWHISLSSWCRNNVYFPVFGLTRKPWLGLYASMLTMGLWHYLSLELGASGVCGTAPGSWSSPGGSAGRRRAARSARRPASRRRPRTSRGSRWLGYPTTFLFVAFGYAFVSTETPRHASQDHGALRPGGR